jgi:diaminohydroxyphosphoribosylaminopyrimidine deaminase/5-amino-6-(5-phosphoribosylamino)uracil reductase
LATRDPFPRVAGGGIAQLEAACIQVQVGLLEQEAQRLITSYAKLVLRGRPWIIAKWAMTLDGKIASRTGRSQWISNEGSRAVVHRLRGRMDGILVGSGTVAVDDPRLTARPPGPRTATRIVMDDDGSLPPQCHLVATATEAPVLVAVGTHVPAATRDHLVTAGCDVVECPGASYADRLTNLLDELGRRRMTNILVEGGSRLMGNLFDLGEIDEVHVFLAPKLIGGADAPSALAGLGVAEMAEAISLDEVHVDVIDDNVHLHGRVGRPTS